MTDAAQALNAPMIWIDLEMTGLEPSKDVIVEIAVIVTDGSLETVIEGPNIVIGATEARLGEMAPVVKDMHRRSGLWNAVKESEVTVEEAEQDVLSFVRKHVPNASIAPLAGNSVHADRAFLKVYMPALESHCHYRNVDVSTVKELAKRWAPEIVEGAPKKIGGHRALADIQESINELTYFRNMFFNVPSQE